MVQHIVVIKDENVDKVMIVIYLFCEVNVHDVENLAKGIVIENFVVEIVVVEMNSTGMVIGDSVIRIVFDVLTKNNFDDERFVKNLEH